MLRRLAGTRPVRQGPCDAGVRGPGQVRIDNATRDKMAANMYARPRWDPRLRLH